MSTEQLLCTAHVGPHPIFSFRSETAMGFMLRSTSTTLMRVWPSGGVISVSMPVISTAPAQAPLVGSMAVP